MKIRFLKNRAKLNYVKKINDFKLINPNNYFPKLVTATIYFVVLTNARFGIKLNLMVKSHISGQLTIVWRKIPSNQQIKMSQTMNSDVKKIFKVLYFLLLAFIAAFCIFQGISNSLKSIADVERKTASVLISEFLSGFEVTDGDDFADDQPARSASCQSHFFRFFPSHFCDTCKPLFLSSRA